MLSRLGPFGKPIEELVTRLPIVSLVLAAEDIDLEAEPEEGKLAEVAAALDALTDVQKKAREAEKDATEAAEQEEKKLSALEDAVSSGADGRTV